MDDLHGRDVDVDKDPWASIEIVGHLNTLLVLRMISLSNITGMRGEAVLVGADMIFIQGVEFCANNLDEVLEHELGKVRSATLKVKLVSTDKTKLVWETHRV